MEDVVHATESSAAVGKQGKLVTILLYLVPVVTALLDHLLLGNALSPLAILGMAAILGGVALVFRVR